MMGRANQSVANLNSVMVEYISGMKLIKAYNMGSKSFQKFSAAVKEENDVWNEMSKRMGPFCSPFGGLENVQSGSRCRKSHDYECRNT